MWLFVEDNEHPGTNIAGGEDTGAYWYNLDTGATVFLTAHDEELSTQKTGYLLVWATAPGTDAAVNVTRSLTGQEWPYVESETKPTKYETVLDFARNKLTQVLLSNSF